MDEAISCLNKAIEINPNYSEAYDKLGLIYEEKKMDEKAIEYYKKAIEIDSKCFNAINGLGNIYLD